jgi:hypothetical protein
MAVPPRLLWARAYLQAKGSSWGEAAVSVYVPAGEKFNDGIMAAYTKNELTGEWEKYRRGGLTGGLARDIRVKPGL